MSLERCVHLGKAVGETPTTAVGTTALPRKSLRIGKKQELELITIMIMITIMAGLIASGALGD